MVTVYTFAGSASAKRSDSHGSFFLLSTLHKYEVEQISPKRATELLEEAERLCADALYDVALRNATVATKVAYWTSLWCGGYEVEEIAIQCIEDCSNGDMTNSEKTEQTSVG